MVVKWWAAGVTSLFLELLLAAILDWGGRGARGG